MRLPAEHQMICIVAKPSKTNLKLKKTLKTREKLRKFHIRPIVSPMKNNKINKYPGEDVKIQ